jgi:membrane-associated phospholipid phosphatase
MAVPQHVIHAERRRHVRAAVGKGTLGLILGILAVILLGIAFIKLSGEVVEQEFNSFDNGVALAIHSTASPTQTAIMNAATDFGELFVFGFVVVTLIIGAVLWYRARHDPFRVQEIAILNGLAPTVAVGGAALLALGVKEIVRRARPNLFPHLADSGYSFPSGHTMVALAFYGMCAFLLVRAVRNGWARAGVIALAAIIVAAVAYSRVYLGEHFPTDVIGSLILGSAWLLALIITLTVVESHLRGAHAVQVQAAAPPPSPLPSEAGEGEISQAGG